jgi:dihydrofolate synthase/folylpolyglutamate synthase
MPAAGRELWLDGGHNEDCGIVLARQAAEWAKEPAAAAALFDLRHAHDQGRLGLPAAAGPPCPHGARRADRGPCRLHAAGGLRTRGRVGLDCLPANDVGAALEDLLATQPAPMRILICGSLYLAGTVLARNG